MLCDYRLIICYFTDVSVQPSNRTNLLRNNPSISITPTQNTSTPAPRPVQPPSYMQSAPHFSSASSQSLSVYPPKLPSSITLTKFDRSPTAHKLSGTGVSTTPPYGPRYLPQYPRSFDKYPVRNEYPLRMPQSYTNNNYSPQYPRPSSSH